MRRKVALGVLVTAGLLTLTGCTSATANTFTIHGTWQFNLRKGPAIFDGPCNFPGNQQQVRVANASGTILQTGKVTSSDIGDVGGIAVCNMQFRISMVPKSARTFMFEVADFQDSQVYTRSELSDLQIVTP